MRACVLGNPLCLNLIVAGNNLVSVDSVCSRIMGYDPSEIQHIAFCHNQRIGELDINKIEVTGDDWNNYVQRFEPPYSLKASLKSMKAIRDIYLGN